MLNRMTFTLGSEVMTSRALTISSAWAPPPTSRKLAGRPPAAATTSSVLMTSPAPFPSTPMSAVQLDVGDPALQGHLLLGVLSGDVAHVGEVGVAEEGVVVDRQLRVDHDHGARRRSPPAD